MVGNEALVSWGKLPRELKEMVVQRSTENSRNALRTCSQNDKHLVENTPLRSFDLLQIRHIIATPENPQAWGLLCKGKNAEGVSEIIHDLIFNTFEELQRRVNEVLISVIFVKTLVVTSLRSPTNMIKLGAGRKKPNVRIEVVNLNMDNGQQLADIISQIEPIYLRSVIISSDYGNADIYDMSQIVHAEKLVVRIESSMREDQLLNLDAQELNAPVTCSVKNYIEKCCQEAGTKFPTFYFGSATVYDEIVAQYPVVGNIFLETSHPQMSLEIVLSQNDVLRVMGGIRFESERQASLFSRRAPSMMRIVTLVCIRYAPNSRRWIVISARNNHLPYEYTFQRMEDALRKVDEILDSADVIKRLSLMLLESLQAVTWTPRQPLLAVDTVNVFGSHSITSILQMFDQIDPQYLREITIDSLEVDDSIFSLTHLQNARNINIEGATLSDEQLLQLNAIKLTNKDLRAGHGYRCNTFITSAALNQYIKRILNHLNRDDYAFRLDSLREDLSINAALNDLMVLRNGINRNTLERTIIIDSRFEKFVLELVITRENSIIATRKYRALNI